MEGTSTATTGTATFIKDRNGTGRGKLYRVDPPMPYRSWGEDVTDGKAVVWVDPDDGYGPLALAVERVEIEVSA